MQSATQHKDVLQKLTALCRGEMAAVESYELALGLRSLLRFEERLLRCKSSHRERVEMLRDHIRRRGGSPPRTSGAWGAFAKAVEGAALAFGKRAALSALEEGEDLGLTEYRTQAGTLDVESVRFVERYLLPAQLETHRIVRDLKRAC